MVVNRSTTFYYKWIDDTPLSLENTRCVTRKLNVHTGLSGMFVFLLSRRTVRTQVEYVSRYHLWSRAILLKLFNFSPTGYAAARINVFDLRGCYCEIILFSSRYVAVALHGYFHQPLTVRAVSPPSPLPPSFYYYEPRNKIAPGSAKRKPQRSRW